MANPHRSLLLLLLAGCGVQLAVFVVRVAGELKGGSGLLFGNGMPIGGDFINLWAAARMVLGGLSAEIYRPEAFVAFEQGLAGAGADLGLRLWAYPPHSLLLVPPFGLIGYFEALALWSAVGLAVLGWGARRLGFGWLETAVIVLSPAAQTCVYSGQSGNLAAGLLLLALSARRPVDGVSVVAAAVLTIKPQTGFLLPLLWLVQRRWWAIVATGVLTVLLAGLSVLVVSTEAWRDYLGETLPLLDLLERHGSGVFMLMIPSAFMSFRILTGDGDLAALLHLVFAAGVLGFLVWRLIAVRDAMAQNALLLVATTLVTPYLHTYDLAVLLCGGLLVVQTCSAGVRPIVYVLVVLACAMPALVMVLNSLGLPLSPLLILPLLIVAGRPPESAR